MAIQHQKEQKLFYGCLIFSLCLSVNAFTIVHVPNIIIEITVWITVVLFLYKKANGIHKYNIALL